MSHELQIEFSFSLEQSGVDELEVYKWKYPGELQAPPLQQPSISAGKIWEEFDESRLLWSKHQKGLLFPKPSNSFLHRLKTSLSTTLHHFPPLAGRLAITELDGETVSFFIYCINAGAFFIQAEADGVTVSDVIESAYVPSIVHSFFPLNGMTNYDGIFEPLLGVQVTELADGIFIGVTINHAVVDVTSFWHFIHSWSEISRECSISQSKSIAKLKEKDNAEAGTNNISSRQEGHGEVPLLSMLKYGPVYTRNRRLSSQEEMSYYLVWVGARPRLSNLPQHYFGNAVMTRIIAMKAKELQEQRVGVMAREMNRLKKSLDGTWSGG
ncbi:hypothetical protein F3Y22_tig00111614pilonHSYRG00083 [Hibiscus syriacus]|uniref:HXXXD-type acyl-transferase family protein n=1 Tax=Hibiscus syriacus TaxID=106335 RepID=A0A6A2YD25_HIBSY|nr:hypothetical protein F3Y22_tig00111614pilonHSYRG00083 [Hibiscus syriacus]